MSRWTPPKTARRGPSPEDIAAERQAAIHRAVEKLGLRWSNTADARGRVGDVRPRPDGSKVVTGIGVFSSQGYERFAEICKQVR